VKCEQNVLGPTFAKAMSIEHMLSEQLLAKQMSVEQIYFRKTLLKQMLLK
jgi:hypothetical protein